MTDENDKASESSPQNHNSLSQEDPKPPSERLFVQNGVNWLIRWMPLGGNLGILVHFALRQDWFLMALSFPILIVTTAWGAYTESFLSRWREVWSDRGKQDVDRLVTVFDKFGEAIRWQFSGIDEKFLRSQADVCRDYAIEGFTPDGLIKPMLEEVFVPLEMATGAMSIECGFQPSRRAEMPRSHRDPSEVYLIWDFLAQVRKVPAYRNLVIQAWGGYGKTTLLRHIAYVYAYRPRIAHRRHKTPKLVPVLLYLRKWRDRVSQETPPSLVDLIKNHYISELPNLDLVKFPSNWAEELLRSGRALIMLDGFDEVAEGERQTVSRWIEKQIAKYPRSVFILTSRPSAYREDYVNKTQAPLFVQPFNEHQQKHFVEQWYWCQENLATGNRHSKVAKIQAQQKAAELIAQIRARKEELFELAKNPLLLNMIATFHRIYPDNQLPERRADLYAQVCRMQLGDRPLAKRVKLPLETVEERQRVLQAVALSMVQVNKPTIPRQWLLELIKSPLVQLDETISAEEFLDRIVEVSELIVEREKDEFEFAHLSFQGYLAAAHIKDLKQEAMLLDNLGKAWWRETILLYVAQLKNPSAILRELMNRGATQLAYDCLKETPRKDKVEPELRTELESVSERIATSFYQNLERFLSNQQWREADEETYRLMLKAVGKEEGQYLTPKDMQNFPCEELQTLDRLWVEFSKGHFGFSVQKQIYVETGNPLDGEHHGKTWNKFADRVGWMIGTEYVRYTKVTFDTSAPKGHLPFCGLMMVEWFSFLAQRLVNCSTQQS